MQHRWTIDKLMSLGGTKISINISKKSTYPFENIKIKKGLGSGWGQDDLSEFNKRGVHGAHPDTTGGNRTMTY